MPDGPHQLSRVEALAAGAMLGMSKTITGKGRDEVLRMIVRFNEAREKARK